jgi:hypothetical protein
MTIIAEQQQKPRAPLSVMGAQAIVASGSAIRNHTHPRSRTAASGCARGALFFCVASHGENTKKEVG